MIGQRHTSGDGYAFTETLHGPNIEGCCVDCGARVYFALEVGRGWRVAPRCSTCARRLHGTVVSVRTSLDPSARLGQGGANCHPQGQPRLELPLALVERHVVAMVRVVGLDELPTLAPRDLWRELVARRRPVGALHTVAIVKGGALDERVSVQSIGLWATWTRHATARKVSLYRTPTGRPRPFAPGEDVRWTGVAVARCRKMSVTQLLRMLRSGEI